MLANHKGEVPFVLLLLPFLLGIAAGINTSYINIILLISLLGILSVVFVILNINYSRWDIHKIKWLGGVFITIILFLTGWVSVTRYNEYPNDCN